MRSHSQQSGACASTRVPVAVATHRGAGPDLPVARRGHCAANVGGVILVSGATTLHANFVPQPCTGVTAPTNGALGTCTSPLAAGATCQPTCNPGYGVFGATRCSSTGTTPSSVSACIPLGSWATSNSLPTSSINAGQSCAAVGALLYVYTQPAFQQYAAATDAWTQGARAVPPARSFSHTRVVAARVPGRLRAQ